MRVRIFRSYLNIFKRKNSKFEIIGYFPEGPKNHKHTLISTPFHALNYEDKNRFPLDFLYPLDI